ncbi:uncharacterized protein LOC143475952 [Brachyhypopomus gauderio]|uniref:uncharacterized protein LOC143475952 n=1 Tax=Brachyhypopomus gauderio TaxID=698409 RepID=UPI004041B9C4
MLLTALGLSVVNHCALRHGPCAEKDAGEMKEPGHENILVPLSDREVQRPRQHCGGKRQFRKMQSFQAQCLATQGGVTHECHPGSLQIKVSGETGVLGISVAGGKDSLPYKENDEGIFISKVTKRGPAANAEVQIGDRVLEVNGQDLREVNHHQAVGALRSARGCIKMKVLRERSDLQGRRVLRQASPTKAATLTKWHQAQSNNSTMRCHHNPAPDRPSPADKTDEVACNRKRLVNANPTLVKAINNVLQNV